MKILSGAIVLLILVLPACSLRPELEESVFKPDPAYPDLPRYSEWGYNTFGAYYNKQPFVSLTRQKYPNAVEIEVEGDTIYFSLSGQWKSNSFGTVLQTMTIRFTGYRAKSFADLDILNGVTLDLTSPSSSIDMPLDPVPPLYTSAAVAKVNSGTFVIRRAQRLYLDDVLQETILSGEFQFEGTLLNEPFSVTNGRFDLGIDSTMVHLLR